MSDHPYRLPALSLEASRSAYEAAKDLAERAHRDYVDARRCHRAIWAPRIFASLVGIAVILAVGETARVRRADAGRCVEAVELNQTRTECPNGRLEVRGIGEFSASICHCDGGAP